MPAHPRLRVAVAGMARHDDKPELPAGRHPVAGRPPFTLASNENPYPPLPGVLDAVRESAERLNRYPDMGCAGLFAALADRFDVPVGHLATGTGSVGIAQQLVQATSGPGDEVVYAWRSFEAYPIITRVAGAVSVRVPLRNDAHDLAAMADVIGERTRLVFVCNPNNPTGTAVDGDELGRFLDRVPRQVLVVIDEAYREFVRDPRVPDGIDLYRDRPNVAVLRTFSKAYGLAGLRVGFAVAHAPVAAALRACAVPFGVNALAQAAAEASLRAEDALADRVETLVRRRSEFVDALRALGWHVPGSQANFVWLSLGERAESFAEACEAAGVAVKPFPGEGVRITLGEPEANERVLRVAAQSRNP